jgi:hypothetical protein
VLPLALRNSRASRQVHIVEAEEVGVVEEGPWLVLRIDTKSMGTGVEAEAILSMGAGAGEARERL